MLDKILIDIDGKRQSGCAALAEATECVPSSINESLPVVQENEQQSRVSSGRELKIRNDLDLYWRQWPSLTLRVLGLPPNWTGRELHNFAAYFGTVTRVEVFVDKNTKESKENGRITWKPVPNGSFWREFYFSEPELCNIRFSLHVEDQDFQKTTTLRSANGDVTQLPNYIDIAGSSFKIGRIWNQNFFLQLFPEITSSEKWVVQKPHMVTRLSKRLVEFHFTVQYNGPIAFSRSDTYKLTLPFQSITIFNGLVEGGLSVLTVKSTIAPQIWRRAEFDVSEISDFQWSDQELWLRQTELVGDITEPVSDEVATRIIPSLQYVQIGRWTAYSFTYDSKSEGNANKMDDTCTFIQYFNMKISRQVIENVRDFPIAVNWNDVEQYMSQYPFFVKYAFDVCVSHNILHEYNLSIELFEKLQCLKPKVLEMYFNFLFSVEESALNPLEVLERFQKKCYISQIQPLLPHYCVYVQRCVITPTTMHLMPVAIEVTNRILRRYRDHIDRFLRVSFQDEGQTHLFSCPGRPNQNEVFTRVYRTLTNGIYIAGRTFEFLAFGNSQLREHGAYFFQSDEDLNAQQIRDWMGDFSSIRSVSKFASRVGQCFSTTRPVNGLKVYCREIPDIEHNGYIFTDGVGRIHKDLAMRIMRSVDSVEEFDIPSAFQFRYGGLKGVLCVDPNTSENEMLYRPSQQKFYSKHNVLEIIRCSRYLPSHLNRQLISILSCLGISDDVFMSLQLDTLKKLERVRDNDEAAMSILETHVDESKMSYAISRMLASGFRKRGDPFVKNLVELYRAWQLKTLKSKARIYVPNGAFLIGVADEMGVLRGYQDNILRSQIDRLDAFFSALTVDEFQRQQILRNLPEIFVQISDPWFPGRKRVITGLCILARNPAFHPGDIRVVIAVDRKELSHLHNVVVLPSKGDRDLASMCSGGDLDGDDYTVIWQPELIPTLLNEPPMDYTPAPTKEIRKVEVRHIVRHMVQYMKNNELGIIANAHLALSDYLDEGVRHEKCLRLAHLHSKAVDAAKTGEKLVLPRELRPRYYPDFMQKESHKRTYNSQKILGKLYRSIGIEEFLTDINDTYDSTLTYITNYEIYLPSANEEKDIYDRQVQSIMLEHMVKSEYEVFTGFLLGSVAMQRDYDLRKKIVDQYTALRDATRRRCENICDYHSENPLDTSNVRMKRLQRMVAAMYHVTWKERREYVNGGPTPLISFPWVFDNVLSKISAGAKWQKDGSSCA